MKGRGENRKTFSDILSLSAVIDFPFFILHCLQVAIFSTLDLIVWKILCLTGGYQIGGEGEIGLFLNLPLQLKDSGAGFADSFFCYFLESPLLKG